MKKSFVLLFIMIGVILVGCAENPALIGIKEKIPESPESEETQIVGKPPGVDVYTIDGSTYVPLDVYCWKEESLCSLEPNPPEEQLYNFPPLQVRPGQGITLLLSTDEIPESDHIYYPDHMELIQIKLDERKEVEINNGEIIAPKESGRYYYSLKLQWDGELKGQAYYVFSVNVAQ
ncbi:hypothetical protein [Paucisalibacillus sp. EB02]|uniref:hypothetical protein n=1 Tax=Paucisalibacillus sp. EB02 TaxID=1347087 RepID=UPI0004B035C6|nr:hypothetical protein [Paucisalibacillus sp. EB02]